MNRLTWHFIAEYYNETGGAHDIEAFLDSGFTVEGKTMLFVYYIKQIHKVDGALFWDMTIWPLQL